MLVKPAHTSQKLYQKPWPLITLHRQADSVIIARSKLNTARILIMMWYSTSPNAIDNMVVSLAQDGLYTLSSDDGVMRHS